MTGAPRLPAVWPDIPTLQRRRYGVIEMEAGQLVGIRFRCFPRWPSLWDVYWSGPRYHSRRPGDHCRVYYNQPLGHTRYLTLAYVLSSRDCTLQTVQRGLQVLDEIARIKQCDALLCEARNSRISDRLLARWGWEPHAPDGRHRNFIKRFYGQYPLTPKWMS